MVHIGSKCETQRVGRFSSQKYSSTAHAYVYVFITAKTKIAGPTRPHSVCYIIEIIMHCTHSMSSHCRGTQRLFFVKYLFREENIALRTAKNF